MKVVIQRCDSGSVLINNKETRSISKGFVILLGMTTSDTEKDVDYIIKKIKNLRIFEDNDNKMNYSLQDINGEVMIISQFTLYASTKDGNRPSFEKCMKYDDAYNLYNIFIDKFKNENIKFVTGEFGSDMKVSLVNDGPVTIIIDSKENL